MSALLEVRGLRADFADARGGLAPALGGIDLRIEAGRCLGITGESGGGKSTLARALVGLVKGEPGVSGGELWIDGERLLGPFPEERFPPRRHWRGFLHRWWRRCYRKRIAARRGRELFFLPQDPRAALAPQVSVGQQLRECLRHRPRAERDARAAELLEQLELARGLLGRYPHELSTGMCQRVLVAMALALPARLIVADEPVAKLDPRIRRGAVELLAKLKQDGRTLVLLTHQLDVIRRLADEVVVLFGGHIAERGPTAAVLTAGADHHPHTEQLLAAFDEPAGGERPSIAPPATHGCPFAPRCPLETVASCTSELPPLEEVGERQLRCVVRAS